MTTDYVTYLVNILDSGANTCINTQVIIGPTGI